jgi:LCP family protein required for cell wall assembly
MSAQEPSSHNSEHISAETKAATDDSQEPPAPPFFPEGSQDQGVFQQKPSVDDPEGIARRHRTSQPRSQKWRVFWISVVLLLLISGTATGIILVPKLYRIDTALKSVTNQALPHIKTTGQAIVIPSPTSLPKDLAGLDHLNLLLLASDTDAKFEGDGVLTQTDMVVRIDFVHHHVTMLSLPRDLWIPSDEWDCCNKLDEISLNETDNATTPLDVKLHGFAHTVATIEQDFHIPINAYAWVGLDGLIKVIDTLGGVDIDVVHPIVDDTYPADVTSPNNPYDYQRIYIAPGSQHLDGKTALEYVRSRHGDLLGDVGRTARQQELLLALKHNLDNREIFVHLEEIATDLQGSVLTSLSIEQVLELASFARGLSSHDFTQLALGLPDYGYGAMIDSPEGNIWVEEPLWDAIYQTINQVFPESHASRSMSLPSLSPTDYQTIKQEGARVLIENGSQDEAAGDKLSKVLTKDGFIVLNVQPADHPYLATQIENFNPRTANTSFILGQLFGVLASTPGTAASHGVDIIIILGQDSAASVEATG